LTLGFWFLHKGFLFPNSTTDDIDGAWQIKP
jgi:hypothetical protein